MSGIVTTNVITFKRLSHIACSGYNIYVKEQTADGEKNYLLDTIRNPKISLDILEKKALKWLNTVFILLGKTHSLFS